MANEEKGMESYSKGFLLVAAMVLGFVFFASCCFYFCWEISLVGVIILLVAAWWFLREEREKNMIGRSLRVLAKVFGAVLVSLAVAIIVMIIVLSPMELYFRQTNLTAYADFLMNWWKIISLVIVAGFIIAGAMILWSTPRWRIEE